MMMLTTISLPFTACSDDDNVSSATAIEVSIANPKHTVYQPKGVINFKLNVKNANASLVKSKFQLFMKSYTTSGSPDLMVAPSFEVQSVENVDGTPVLKLGYDLNGLMAATCAMEVRYNDVLTGTLDLKLFRSHEYKVTQFITKENMMDRYLFPAFQFLDELGIEHMDVEELAIKENLFLSEGENPMYPAMQENSDKAQPGDYGRTTDGDIFIFGLKNGKFGHMYSLINKIKLKQPDAEGNEYIWLEFPFVLKPETVSE